jgi:hypothetical protein
MSMIYNAQRGWVEIEPIILRESVNESGFDVSARTKFEADQTIKLIDDHIKNVIGYANYVKNNYKKNTDDARAIEDLEGFSEYLTKTIGPGMIGEWKHFSQNQIPV